MHAHRHKLVYVWRAYDPVWIMGHVGRPKDMLDDPLPVGRFCCVSGSFRPAHEDDPVITPYLRHPTKLRPKHAR